MQGKKRLLLHNIKQLVQVCEDMKPYYGMQQCDGMVIKNKQSVVVDGQGVIADILGEGEVEQKYNMDDFEEVIQCGQLCVMPGLVDAHTHTVFYGDRSKEYDMKLNGMGYVQIFNQGLGIRYSTQSVGKATVDQLVTHLDKYLPRMSKLGTTTVEIKSGYGLDAENELKMLTAIEVAKHKYANSLTIVSTFCGAHAIPKGKTEEEQTADVIEKQIPAIKEAMEKKEISPKFIDVFTEKGFFGVESSLRIMEEGKKIGLIPSFHGDELNNLESGSLGVKAGARAIAHLEYLSEESCRLMAQHKIAAVLLPTTQNIEKLPIPPIATMRKENMIVALGTDFCPNAFCYNMNLAAHYACTNYRLTPNEALAACTINAAYALDVHHEVGSIEVGKKADFLLLDCENWVYIVYGFGDCFAKFVIKNGRVVGKN